MRGTNMLAKPRAAKGQGLTFRTLTLLATVLLTATPSASHAEETAVDAAPLESLLRSGGAKSARFVLTSGKIVVGRVIRIEDDGLLIRRPSAGLLSLPLHEIAGVKVKAPDGEFLFGKVVRMAGGDIGWIAEDDASSSAIARSDDDLRDQDGEERHSQAIEGRRAPARAARAARARRCC